MRIFRYIGPDASGQGLHHGEIIRLNDSNPIVERFTHNPHWKELVIL